jgi:hypothetical protein
MQIRVQGGFSAQHDQVRSGVVFLKWLQPCLHRFKRQYVLTVLLRIDIAVPALKITLSEDMKK